MKIKTRLSHQFFQQTSKEMFILLQLFKEMFQNYQTICQIKKQELMSKFN